ncbi:hypothetical protein CHLRE_11g483150v5 [Chlamydomonas reinhardtii]|uniref:Small nuclear ribonucleoprotein Prp3 C-terminal domain-containing protein n=1 Tax=Chlamydomonas reinhardtii TaxID=3055 RepID=A0A2K3D8V8_CHLRE|nr:uncharacterized protein CHLRE_11g483150v5 [Chlamydomonas reinhardtii]PNW76970.1 hypothetical protein CHLRE_11g483150v5 [Chlamydomonas reinhardtii]
MEALEMSRQLSMWPPRLLLGGQPVALRFVLPRAYPLPAPGPGPGPVHRQEREGTATVTGREDEADQLLAHCAQLAVECSAPRHVHEALSGAVRAAAQREVAAGGGECLLLALEALREAVAEAESLATAGSCCGEPTSKWPAGSGSSSTTAADRSTSNEASTCGLLCVLVWLHHLKSLTKRKLIVQWARELSLAGAVKPGFPGVVVVEGLEPDVREFLARMRSLTWQAMQVRGEDLLPLSPAEAASLTCGRAASGAAGTPKMAGLGALKPQEPTRRLCGSFKELDESGMGQLGEMCREGGLQHIFLTALKL